MLVEGTNVDKEEAGSSYSYPGVDILKEITTAGSNLSGIFEQVGRNLKTYFGVGAIFSAAADLDKKSADLVKLLGVGYQRTFEIQRTLATAIPQFVAMGLKAEDAATTYESLIKKFNVNLKLSDEQLVKLAATSKVTGINVDELAKSFMDVGVSLSGVETRMLDVTKIANQAGVTVGAVASGVVKNLDKMNLYNFDGGVKGLAKMAAQASRLGIDMEKVFGVVDDVFNPEGAIELAASLQRLGVQTSEMLDPLRLMDLAQNDPTELQNQIVGMTKQFTRFNETTKQFEILPGAKRQMNEVAKALGMTGGEFQKMALNSANFDQKLKQIKFSPDVKEEDRELVATMAQINEKGEAEIRIRQFDETGKPTGNETLVKASEITAEQIKDLRKEQEIKGKSMEDIAFEQLSEAAKTNAILDERLTAYRYGMAETKLVETMYTGTMEGTRGLASKLPKESEFYIENVNETLDNVSALLKETLDGLGIDFDEITEDMLEFTSKIGDYLSSATETISDYYDILMGTNTTEKSSPSAIITSSQKMALQEMNASVASTPTTTASTTLPEKVELTHVFDFTKAPASMTSAEVTTILQNWASNPINANAIVMAAQKINSGLIA